MARLLLAGFLIAHGLIHAAIYAIPKNPDKPAPFDPSYSWAFAAGDVAERPTRTFGVRVSWLTALLFAGAGIALLVNSSLWVSMAICAAALGLLLKGLFFHPWLILGVLIDIALVWAATTAGQLP
jgi:hypothetical protein